MTTLRVPSDFPLESIHVEVRPDGVTLERIEDGEDPFDGLDLSFEELGRVLAALRPLLEARREG